jgi:hypothetical protein
MSIGPTLSETLNDERRFKNLAIAIASENYGDAGYNDQFWIRKGWEWARAHAIEIGLPQ